MLVTLKVIFANSVDPDQTALLGDILRVVLIIPWFVRMYDAIMQERERVHYRTYMRRTIV